MVEAETTTEVDGIRVKQLPLPWNIRKETPLLISGLSWTWGSGGAAEQRTGGAGRSRGAEQPIHTHNPHQAHLFSRAGPKANLQETASLLRPGVEAPSAGSASTRSDAFPFLGGTRGLASDHGVPRPAAPKPPSSPGRSPGSLLQATGLVEPDLKGNVGCPRRSWGWCQQEGNLHEDK